MPSKDAIEVAVLKRYPRAVTHMRRQAELLRFGMLCGAGLSKPFGGPNWEELVVRLSRDSAVNAEHILSGFKEGETLPYKTQAIFEHYRSKQYQTRRRQRLGRRELDLSIAFTWSRLERKHLYAKAPADFPAALRRHPYLLDYLPLIRRMPMTVTYNFDDFLEKAVANDPDRGEAERRASRGYDTVTSPWGQFRRQNANIYHPNGFFPQESLETPRNRFVFSEASYAEQMIGLSHGDHAGMLNYLSKHTCLLIGLSFSDETLKSLLVQSANTNPGNYHYYVKFNDPRRSLDGDQLKAIEDTNFSVYNLCTLYLTSSEIAALGRLLHCPSNHFFDCAKSCGVQPAYRFYITGALGVGKSSTIDHFRNLDMFEEWSEPRRQDLGEDWRQLAGEKKKNVDSFVATQFRIKNDKLRNHSAGICLLDRGPLDPLAFTPRRAWAKKADYLLRTIGSVDDGHNFAVLPGHVILLKGDPR